MVRVEWVNIILEKLWPNMGEVVQVHYVLYSLHQVVQVHCVMYSVQYTTQ